MADRFVVPTKRLITVEGRDLSFKRSDVEAESREIGDEPSNPNKDSEAPGGAAR